MKQNKAMDVVGGSDNPFKDVGHPNPEEALAKAELAMEIYAVIEARKLTQKKAAKLLGIDQPRISDIVCGKLSRYSIDRLIRFLRLLGKDVEIHIKPHRRRTQETRLEVVRNHSKGA
jgi:predicted XRE-type DNA-binding protein